MNSTDKLTLIIAVLSAIGGLIVILLTIIAFFIKGTLSNLKNRLDAHSKKHDDQGIWNEEHTKILSSHDRFIQIYEKAEERRSQSMEDLKRELHTLNGILSHIKVL